MDVYIIIGNSDQRKSSVIRCLTGVAQIKTIQITTIQKKIIDVYVSIKSLQESKTLPKNFIQSVNQNSVKAVFIPLWENGNNNFPDASVYIKEFKQAGWTINKVAHFGVKLPSQNYTNSDICVPNSNVYPSNQTASTVRTYFGWM
ncbi:hypothetical protein KP612_06185 [Treponema denticola]|uniref:Uncharacterized protein n=1 Tax=Treponema denticola H-22 TaxID=999432 RepID=A0A0E2E8S5_TREDN|nr:hypothetical protein [Treponema denticola]EMB36245.1 hypothetical protein HMPREF9726_00437 [Treponema denticola H-22]